MPEIGLTTVKARIVADHTGNCLELLVLVGRNGVLEPLVEYQVLFQARSRSWQKALCLAVRLLLEYAAANAGAFVSPRELFQTFSVRLRSGTFGADGLDPSGLYWLPRQPRNANQLIEALTAFSAWLATTYVVPSVNPLRDATRPEQVIAAAAWAHRNQASFLGHTASQGKARQQLARTPWVPRVPTATVLGEKKPRFPEDKFLPLLFEGFAAHRQLDSWLRLDLRCVLIALLQHGGGLRASECFQLWVEDVTGDPLDPTQALVRIGHPEAGCVQYAAANGEEATCSRREYLAARGLLPRNRQIGKRHAGWKQPTLDGKWYLQVYWSDPGYGQLFLHLWRLYLRQLSEIPRPHPWAFVNMTHQPGEPLTMAQYARAHAEAVQRIGLVPRKAAGTTEHGHRHAYLYRLAEAGVKDVVIKRAAHHQSIESQAVYTAPEQARIRAAIDEGYQRLEKPLDLAQIQTQYQSVLKPLEAR